MNNHVHVCANPSFCCQARGWCECPCGARRLANRQKWAKWVTTAPAGEPLGVKEARCECGHSVDSHSSNGCAESGCDCEQSALEIKAYARGYDVSHLRIARLKAELEEARCSGFEQGMSHEAAIQGGQALTSEQALFIVHGNPFIHRYTFGCSCVECEDITAKLRRLSQSDTGDTNG